MKKDMEDGERKIETAEKESEVFVIGWDEEEVTEVMEYVKMKDLVEGRA